MLLVGLRTGAGLGACIGFWIFALWTWALGDFGASLSVKLSRETRACSCMVDIVWTLFILNASQLPNIYAHIYIYNRYYRYYTWFQTPKAMKLSLPCDWLKSHGVTISCQIICLATSGTCEAMASSHLWCTWWILFTASQMAAPRADVNMNLPWKQYRRTSNPELFRRGRW